MPKVINETYVMQQKTQKDQTPKDCDQLIAVSIKERKKRKMRKICSCCFKEKRTLIVFIAIFLIVALACTFILLKNRGLFHNNESKTDEKLVSTKNLAVPKNTCSLTISSKSKQFQVKKIILNKKTFDDFFQTEKDKFTGEKWISLKNIVNSDENNNVVLKILYKKDFVTSNNHVTKNPDNDVANDDDVTVAFHESCNRLLPILGYFSRNTKTTDHVDLLKRDKCDFEHVDSRVNCNWREIVPNGELPSVDHQDRRENSGEVPASCAAFQGVQEKENVQNKFFVKVVGDPDSGEKFTTAYMTSPTFDVTQLDHVTFSMHSAIHCDGSSLRGYVVPASNDVLEEVEGAESFFEVDHAVFGWRMEKFNFDVSALAGEYRVVLKASVLNNQTCKGDTKYCGVGPTINIDEIVIDGGLKCNNGSARSVKHSFSNANENAPDRWEKTSNEEESWQLAYYTSPSALSTGLLKSTKNCSCKVTFEFTNKNLIFGVTTIRLEQKYGRTPNERMSNKKILWKRRRSGTEEVELNLVDDGVPFVLEFASSEYGGYPENVSLENIAFVGCDFVEVK